MLMLSYEYTFIHFCFIDVFQEIINFSEFSRICKRLHASKESGSNDLIVSSEETQPNFCILFQLSSFGNPAAKYVTNWVVILSTEKHIYKKLLQAIKGKYKSRILYQHIFNTYLIPNKLLLQREYIVSCKHSFCTLDNSVITIP